MGADFAVILADARSHSGSSLRRVCLNLKLATEAGVEPAIRLTPGSAMLCEREQP